MSSSVPAVIPAFKALAISALPAGSQVWLGTTLPVNQAPPGSVTGISSGITLLITGIHFLEDEFAELGPMFRHEEHYNIEASLMAWAGDNNFDARTADAYAVYADLTVAISNNPTLNLPTPAPRLAWPRQLDYMPAPTAFGQSTATISFEVEVQARVTSLT